MAHPYHSTIKRAQDRLAGRQPLKAELIREYDNNAFELPIQQGNDLWMEYRCKFKRYVVVNEDETWGSENPKFMGTTLTNETKSMWGAPQSNLNDALMKPEVVNLEICKIVNLNNRPYSVEISCRAFDSWSDVTDDILAIAHHTISTTAGAVSFLPYGSTIQAGTDSLIDGVFDSAGADNEVGSLKDLVRVVPQQRWRRQSSMLKWTGYQYVLFENVVRSGPGSNATKDHEEMYLALFRHDLLAYPNGFPPGDSWKPNED